jgi:hypothetical protein
MAFKWKSFLNKLKDVVVPAVGMTLGGPLGGILGGAVAGATGRGRPKLGNIVRGAGTAAAGIGISKGLSALKGAMTGAGSATEAVTRGVTEPTALLAKGKEFIPTQAITPPPVSSLASAGAKAATRNVGFGSGGAQSLRGGLTSQQIQRAGEAIRGTVPSASEPTALLAKGKELAPSLPTVPNQSITSQSVSPLGFGGDRSKESVMDKLKGLFGKGGWIERNPEIAKGIAMGAFEAFQEDPRMAQLEFEKKAYEDEQERRRRVAELLRPLYEQTYRSLGS